MEVPVLLRHLRPAGQLDVYFARPDVRDPRPEMRHQPLPVEARLHPFPHVTSQLHAAQATTSPPRVGEEFLPDSGQDPPQQR
jgi:hypothetical protein